jgi:hypothetical protein
MDLNKDLLNLKKLMDKENIEDFKNEFNLLCEKYPGQKDAIVSFVEKELDESGKRIDAFIEEAKVKVQLMDITKIISLSYVSEHYFNRTGNWLYQKINGNRLNDNSERFTSHEIEILNFAIQDISKKLGSTVISL